jgi:hypothetical protein
MNYGRMIAVGAISYVRKFMALISHRKPPENVPWYHYLTFARSGK